jgi:hypothetical protein
MKKKFFKVVYSIFYVLNKKLAFQLRGFLELKYWFNLDNPKTYNEKINFKKLFNKDKLVDTCSNKFELKNYIESLKLNVYTTKTFWFGRKLTSEIFKELPKQFVVKISNDNGPKSWEFVKNKDEANINKIVNKFNKRVKYKYGAYSGEKWYDRTKNIILIEEYLDSSIFPLEEIKVYCFNYDPLLNKPTEYILRLIKDRDTSKSQSFYDKDWNLLDIEYMGNKNHGHKTKPVFFTNLIENSKKISSPFDHVRIDYLIYNNKLYVNELTFADSSGFIKFGNFKTDLYFGSLWTQKK